ncbi:STAS domain-containing protein [Acidovorax sp. Leaf160]|uniref:STAS domain-containing protein n=1 Tax=Acidovorax sp. Leaf160 TaxID=1736280 RepID=UPI0006FB3219|nr:STAS domain-containing protein [Acidovorax sp. Leaf160]KQR55497.1 polyvinylalcohol dehydrogenase [Acidovorax sp. Leaf160]
MTTHIQNLLREEDANALLQLWLDEARASDTGLGRSAQSEASQILTALSKALQAGAQPENFGSREWADLQQVLSDFSRSRAAQGQTAGATSLFVLALKRPLFSALQKRLMAEPETMMAAIWSATMLVDRMAQHTVTSFQQVREEIIVRQQEELLELSTPVVKLWDGVLAVPMIGTLDSNRTQVVMETLLQRIVETEAELAIIDITGVPTVDTLVAQHLLKTVTAIRLMGADCIISGIRPQIAQTIVHLGIDLDGIGTKATLADALRVALQRTGWHVTRRAD